MTRRLLILVLLLTACDGRAITRGETAIRDGGAIDAHAPAIDAGAPAPRVIVGDLSEDVHGTACVVGPDGTLHVAYTTASGVYYFADAPGGLREDIATDVSAPVRPSIALRNGLPWVSYVDASSEPRVEVAQRNGIWLRETLPTAELAGYALPTIETDTGLWLGASVYYAKASGRERYVVFHAYDDRVWSGTSFLLRGEPHAAALDSLGLVQLVMYGIDRSYLAVLRDEGSRWVEYRIANTSDIAGYAALALDSGDRPHVVHDDGGQLRYAFSPREEEWQTDVIEGTRTSFFAIGVRGASTPMVAYYQSGEADVRLVVREGEGWRRETLDEDGDVGRALSMAVDDAGRARVVYFDATRRALKVVER
jgi:hypothetical protein